MVVSRSTKNFPKHKKELKGQKIGFKNSKREDTTKSWAEKVKTAIPKKVDHSDNEIPEPLDLEVEDPTIDNGKDILLPCSYVLWSHEIYNKEWDLKSYKRVCVLNNISDFWRLFNNFHRIGYKFMHFFLMKDGIEPTWEHERNRNGGICSLKIELENSFDIWEDLNARMVSGFLNNNYDDINGISISPKNNWAIIKIWNSDNKNDLISTLFKEVIDRYQHLSIKYKSNTPEF